MAVRRRMNVVGMLMSRRGISDSGVPPEDANWCSGPCVDAQPGVNRPETKVGGIMTSARKRSQGSRAAAGVPVEDLARKDVKPTRGSDEANATTLRAIMSSDPFTIGPEATVREAVELLAEKRASGLPVVSNGNLVGIITAGDILEFSANAPSEPTTGEPPEEWVEREENWDEEEGTEEVAAYYFEAWPAPAGDVAERFAHMDTSEWDVLAEYTVADVMSRRLLTLPPDSALPDAARFMMRHGVHRVLVVEDGELVGIATTFDFVRAIAEGRV
jgi:CBS domain-containing protein